MELNFVCMHIFLTLKMNFLSMHIFRFKRLTYKPARINFLSIHQLVDFENLNQHPYHKQYQKQFSSLSQVLPQSAMYE